MKHIAYCNECNLKIVVPGADISIPEIALQISKDGWLSVFQNGKPMWFCPDCNKIVPSKTVTPYDICDCRYVILIGKNTEEGV